MGGGLTKIILKFTWNNKQVRIDKEAFKKKANIGVFCSNRYKIYCNTMKVWSWLRNLQTNQ